MDEALTKALIDDFDPGRDARYEDPCRIFEHASDTEAQRYIQWLVWREETAERRLRQLAVRHGMTVLVVDTDDLEASDLEDWIESRGIRYACIYELATTGLFFPQSRDATFVKLARFN